MAVVKSKCPICGNICKTEDSLLVKGGAMGGV